MMAAVLQYLIVGVIVVLALLYAAVKYLPKSWRQRLVYKLSGRNGKGRLVQFLDTDASCGSGCDTCGSCAPAALPETDEKGRKIIQVHVKR